MNGARSVALVLWATLWPSGRACAQDVGGEAGLAVTAGSGGYRRVAASLDWEGSPAPWQPYAWSEFTDDNYTDKIGFGGGAWHGFHDDLAAKFGLGFAAGHLKNPDVPAHSLLLETGLENASGGRATGIEYRGTFGGITETSDAPTVARNNPGRGRPRGENEARTFSIHELAAYARLPAGGNRLGLRAALILPSYAGAFLAETVSLRVPASKSWRVTPALTFEQGDVNGIYGTLAASYLF